MSFLLLSSLTIALSLNKELFNMNKAEYLEWARPLFSGRYLLCIIRTEKNKYFVTKSKLNKKKEFELIEQLEKPNMEQALEQINLWEISRKKSCIIL